MYKVVVQGHARLGHTTILHNSIVRTHNTNMVTIKQEPANLLLVPTNHSTLASSKTHTYTNSSGT